MAKKTSRALLLRSCEWIRANWNAKNLDVPEELLSRWIYCDREDEEEPSGFYLAVFSFGYLQHDLIANNVPEGVKRTFPTSVLIELFQYWQLKLALVEIHRLTDLRIRPSPLFDFPVDERVEIWRDAGSKPGFRSIASSTQ